MVPKLLCKVTRKTVVMFIAIASALMFGLFLHYDVDAVVSGNCNTAGLSSLNDSIYDACNLSGTRGTMWISDSERSDDITSEVIIDNPNEDRVKVYLHGAILKGPGANADNICLVKGWEGLDWNYIVSSGSEGYSKDCEENRYDVFEDVPSTMWRDGNAYPWTNNISSYVKEIKLDVKKLIEEESGTVSGNYRVYKIEVKAFRCFSGRSYGSTGCYSSKSTSTVKVRIASKFEGKTEVSGSVARTVGYRNTADTQFVNIDNCSAMDGCSVTFNHSLKRTQGSGATGYTVSRTSNFVETTSSSKAIISNSDLRSGTFDNNESSVFSESFTLYPGMVICEKLEFTPDDNGSSNVYTRICVAALGNVETSLGMKVKNNSVEKYRNYSSVVYAKPGDNITYQATYNPTLQYALRIRPEKLKINTGGWMNNGKPCNTVVASSGLLGFCQLQVLYNNKKAGTLKNWDNSFTVVGSNFGYSSDYKYNNGDDGQKVETNDRNVVVNDVGKNLSEQAKTNQNNNTSTTPKKVIFSAGSNAGVTASVNVKAKVETDVASSNIVDVLVPYNFNNDISLDVDGGGDGDIKVDAGGNKTFSYEININPKPNSETDDTYATTVPDVQIKIQYCFDGGDCVEMGPIRVDEIEKSINEIMSGNLDYYSENGVNVKRTIDLNIPDVPAGTRFCARASMYPSNSGADTNIDPGQFGGWTDYGDPICFIVIKKPSFQVWGGGVYSAGILNIPVSEKRYLSQNSDTWQDIINKILAGRDAEAHVFGSWTELGLVANGTVKGLASGAGTGYSNTNDAANSALSPNNLGGSAEGTNPSYCLRSTLSFANSSCSSGSVGGLSSMQTGPSSDKSALMSRFSDPESGDYKLEERYDDIDISEIITPEDTGEIRIPESQTKIIKAKDHTIIIGNNITYAAESYEKLEQIPKLIIYAKNIAINCSVTRIDAVLIADDNINTCADISDVNAPGRSNQLIINGATISNTLTLGRTYGAATGKNSIVPAEIVNYDSSLILWSNKQSSSSSTGKLTEASRTELAPRY